ncbi:MAG: NAD-dependent epimerase/dehydratase family protein [Polyangiaceae bacterium]
MKRTWTLVTGATGFIGSAVVRQLIERGSAVRAFVRPGANLGAFQGLPRDRFQLAYGDVTLESTVYRSLMGCDRLFHVASVFKYGGARPEQIIEPAVLGTRAVLAAARAQKIERIVVTSSAAVLGTSRGDAPMDETTPNQLLDPEVYVRAKIEADQVVQDHIAEGMPIINVLPSAVFGPGDRKPTPNGRTLIDYLRLSPSRRIPATDGGVCVVDVDDVARGHVLAMEHGRLGERYLLGGENLTYTQLFELMHELTGLARPGKAPSPGVIQLAGTLIELYAGLTGTEPILTRRLARDYAFARVWVSSEKAERELGYKHRPARETLARAVNYYLSNGYVPGPLASTVRLSLRPT